MTVNQKTIRAALKRARQDPALDKALHDWWQHKGKLPTAWRGKPFGVWLIDLLNELSTTIDEVFHGEQTAANIVDVLRIHAVGDPLAIQMAEEAEKDGFGTDTDCYVEDGCVYANVYLHHEDPEKAKARAAQVRDTFTAAGYSAVVWVDEMDEHDVTVDTQIDFKSFLAQRQNMVKYETDGRE